MKNVIGRLAMVAHDEKLLHGLVIDKDWKGKARRIRIQTTGNYQGKVVQPYEYKIIEFIT